MMINGLRNKRHGPGGGTRRLHHLFYGGEIGSTYVLKVLPFIRYCIRRIGLIFIDAKPNGKACRTVARNDRAAIKVQAAA